MDKSEDGFSKLLTLRYLVALMLIGSLITASFLALEQLIRDQESSAALVNISGRQRMISQRIAMLSTAIIYSQDEQKLKKYKTSLKEAIALLNLSHQALVKGSVALNLPGILSDELKSIYFSEPENINKRVAEYIKHANNLLASDPGDSSENNSDYIYILNAAMNPLLNSLDRAVSQYQKEGEQKVQKTSRIELWVWISAVSLLLFEAIFIFRPMVKHAVRLLTKSEKSRAELNEKIIQLNKAQQVLIQSEKIASIGRMVSGFAHEINTPVGIVVGGISNLQENTKTLTDLINSEAVTRSVLNEEIALIEESAELILRHANRAANLITGLKQTSVDMQSDAPREFVLSELFQDMRFSLSHKLKTKNAQFEYTCSDEICLIGKPGLIDQILTNFMINSIIHGFKENKENNKITLIAKINDNQTLQIIYSDNGAGISEESLERIYEPFFTTSRMEGTGLGMYICYNIVTNNLNGSIDCKSTNGQGVEFTITIPLEKQGSNYLLGNNPDEVC